MSFPVCVAVMEALVSLGNLLQDLSSRLAAVEAHLGITPPESSASGTAAAGAGGAAPKKAEVPLAPAVIAFDALIANTLAPFVANASAIGDKAAELVSFSIVFHPLSLRSAGEGLPFRRVNTGVLSPNRLIAGKCRPEGCYRESCDHFRCFALQESG